MLLRKIIFSGLVALVIGIFGSYVSFDFENYALYAERVDASLQRFENEPIFLLFILAGDIANFSPQSVIQSFIIVGTFFIVFSISTLANRIDEFKYPQSIIAIIISFPFLIFTVIVPRQALATGFALLAISQARRTDNLKDWRIIISIILSLMTHGLTAAFGGLLLIAGYIKKRTLFFTILPIVAFLILLTLLYDNNFLNLISSTYQHYVNNFRDTGTFRLFFFSAIAALYFFLIPKKSGGFFSKKPLRNFLISLIFYFIVIILYVFLATDAIRLSYLIGIIMTTEIVYRTSLFRVKTKDIKISTQIHKVKEAT